ncbi:MAG: chemotaxis protein CheW [Deltaproteobacteria bacterium]|nr:chemotaxis protein CheW [Deltaproteobacteria bacterium]
MVNSVSEKIYATFVVNNSYYAMDINDVKETINHPERIFSIPASDPVVEGIFNLRGNVIPVINLRRKFKMGSTAEEICGKVAIISHFRTNIGLVFDDIDEVLRLSTEDVDEFITDDQENKLLISGVIRNGDKLIHIIDPDLLFREYSLPLKLKTESDREEKNRNISQMAQLVSFTCGGQEFGISIENVLEMVKTDSLENRVDAEDYIPGVLNLRGKLISILDFGKYLRVNDGTELKTGNIIILKGNGFEYGLLVESIRQVIRYEKDSLLAVPELGGLVRVGKALSGVLSLDERNILAIEPEKMLSKHCIEQLSRISLLHTDTEILNKNSDEDENDELEAVSEERVLITFRLDYTMGIPIEDLVEILKNNVELLKIPGDTGIIDGLLNLRGKVIPVINMRRYYKLDEIPSDENTRILIIKKDKFIIGLKVDSVEEILKTAGEKMYKISSSLLSEVRKCFGNDLDSAIHIKSDSGDEKNILIFNTEQFIKKINKQNINKIIGE